MAVKRVIKGARVGRMGTANSFLIGGDDGLTLIDAGRQRSSGRSAGLAVRQASSSTQFSLTASLIKSAVPLQLCGKPVRGPACTRLPAQKRNQTSRWLHKSRTFQLNPTAGSRLGR